MNITIEVGAVEAEASRLDKLDLVNAQVKAFAGVVDRAYETNAKRMNDNINLDDAYLRRRFIQKPIKVQSNRLIAEIIAEGSLTTLSHYSPQTLTTPAIRAKGDSSRGIRPGTKAAGVKVEVKRGAPKVIERAFILPLKRGSISGGNGTGVFTRDASGKLRHRYGPSVYQLFRFTLGQTVELTADDLERSLTAAVEDLL